jgi:hypothetical protein
MSPMNQPAVVNDLVPRRGEVWLVSFDPALGGEIQKPDRPSC